MKILIDIGHPAHVHLFKYFAKEMISKGHKVIFTTREKEFEIRLLKEYGFHFISFGKHYRSSIGKLFGLVKFDFQMLWVGLRHKPNLYLSHGSFYAAHAAWLLRRPHIAMEDTGNMEQVRLYLPFSKAVLTSTSFHRDFGNKQIRYNGYHELAYLHPKYFTPEKEIIEALGIQEGEEYVLLRFISWNASHDKGQKGLSDKTKFDLVNRLASKYRVFISAESELPERLEKFRLKTEPENIHSILAYASLFITEGATMASECAMLGTPSIYINSIFAGTIDDQRTAGLIFHYQNDQGVLEKVMEFLDGKHKKDSFLTIKNKYLADKIDVTAFLIWFIEKYPKSLKVMKENPDFQYNFR